MNMWTQTKDTHKYKVSVNTLNQLTSLYNRDGEFSFYAYEHVNIKQRYRQIQSHCEHPKKRLTSPHNRDGEEKDQNHNDGQAGHCHGNILLNIPGHCHGNILPNTPGHCHGNILPNTPGHCHGNILPNTLGQCHANILLNTSRSLSWQRNTPRISHRFCRGILKSRSFQSFMCLDLRRYMIFICYLRLVSDQNRTSGASLNQHFARSDALRWHTTVWFPMATDGRSRSHNYNRQIEDGSRAQELCEQGGGGGWGGGGSRSFHNYPILSPSLISPE